VSGHNAAAGQTGGPPPPPPPLPPAGGDPTGGLIPYRNVPALVAYYLGVFSLIPCVGLGLGIAAVVLGALGLSKAARQPQAKGKVHAWVGIILGSIVAAVHVGFIVIRVVVPALE
jgi:hypothetical protein